MNKHQAINFGNPLLNIAGNAYYEKKPSNKKILEELLRGFSEYGGVTWNPVNVDGGYSLMLNQCPGACGHVWRVRIEDKDTASWLVSEINHRRFPAPTDIQIGDNNA